MVIVSYYMINNNSNIKFISSYIKIIIHDICINVYYIILMWYYM